MGRTWQGIAPDSVSENNSETNSENNLDEVVPAFLQGQISAAWQDDAWRHKFINIWTQTAHRLRNLLHQHSITAYYFDGNGRQAIPTDFWPIPAADGVLEKGTYWPFGEPKDRFANHPPNYPVLLKQSELDALLTEERPEKRRLPESKIPELVAALRELEHLPNREKQREALRKQFEQYHLTDEILRDVEKQVPRKPGRKSPSSDQ